VIDVDLLAFVPIMSVAARHELACRIEFERYGNWELIEAERYTFSELHRG
jgi:hypothetical protein